MVYHEHLKVSKAIVDRFIEFSGDRSPIHANAEGAKLYGFSDQLAHGTILIALFSKIVGTKISKPYTVAVCCGLSVEWPNPVFIDDEVELSVSVRRISESTEVQLLELIAINQRGEVVMRGNAKVKIRGRR